MRHVVRSTASKLEKLFAPSNFLVMAASLVIVSIVITVAAATVHHTWAISKLQRLYTEDRAVANAVAGYGAIPTSNDKKNRLLPDVNIAFANSADAITAVYKIDADKDAYTKRVDISTVELVSGAIAASAEDRCTRPFSITVTDQVTTQHPNNTRMIETQETSDKKIYNIYASTEEGCLKFYETPQSKGLLASIKGGFRY